MLHEIKVSFDTSTGKVDVDAGTADEAQALTILENVRRQIRHRLGSLEIIVSFDPKTNRCGLSLDMNEMKTWAYVSSILGIARGSADFQEWWGSFMMANAAAREQAMREAQGQALAAQVKGKLVI